MNCLFRSICEGGAKAVERGQIVVVDTNIIIESLRIGSWSALTTYFGVLGTLHKELHHECP